MSIKTFEQFAVYEDATANLIQQKNALAQQINDLQKKMLDVQAQIVSAQKQTLAQNPQSQIPMGESTENNFYADNDESISTIPADAHIIHTSYYFAGRGKGQVYVHFTHNGKAYEGEIDVSDFEDFIDDEANEYEREDLQRYVRSEYDGDGGNTYWFATEDFWKELPSSEQQIIILKYLQQKHLIG